MTEKDFVSICSDIGVDPKDALTNENVKEVLHMDAKQSLTNQFLLNSVIRRNFCPIPQA